MPKYGESSAGLLDRVDEVADELFSLLGVEVLVEFQGGIHDAKGDDPDIELAIFVQVKRAEGIGGGGAKAGCVGEAECGVVSEGGILLSAPGFGDA